MSSVLRPIIDDIKKLVGYQFIIVMIMQKSILSLKEQGHVFEVKGVPQVFYGTIAVVSADNPASNCLGGFKESTSAHHYCRQCMASSEEARLQVRSQHCFSF